MPAYSGSPGRSKSIHYGGGSTYHPRTRRVTVPHGAPAPPAPTGGSVSHAPRHSINRGVVAVRSPSGTVTHYARQTPGISPKVARRRARVAQQRAATVAHSRAALKKAAMLHHIAPHLTKQAHAELAKAPPHIAIAAAKKVAPKAVAKALQNVKQPKMPAQTKVKKLKKLPVPTGGGLTKGQQVFAGVTAKKAHLDPRFVASWMLAEEPPGKVNPATGNQDWLNIAYPGHLTASAQNPIFNKPVSAGKATGKWITGRYNLPGYGTSSPSIQAAAAAAAHTKDPAQQAAAFGASDWGTSASTIGANIGSFGVKKVAVKGAGALASPEKALTGKSLTRFQAIKREAARIDKFHLPYELGGGHQASPAPGPRKTNYDCSGVVSRVLQRGGYNVPTQVSGAYMNWGKPGPGAVTIYANPEHVFMRIGNRFFGTSTSNPGGGAGWVKASTYSQSYLSTFTVRHPTGLGKEAGFVAPAGGTGLTDLGGGTSVGMTSGVHLASPGSSSSPILPENVSTGQKGKAKTQAQSNADRARRQVLQGAIARLGKTPPKPKAVALTSANTTTALRSKKTVIAGA